MKGRSALLGLQLLVAMATVNAAAAQQAAVQGIVSDADSGSPLDGTSVVLEGGTPGPRATVTDGNGFYQLGGITPGTYTLRVRHLGYVEFRETLNLPAGEGITRSVRLQPDPLVLEGVVITPQRGAVERELGRQRITPGDIRLVPTPAAAGDIASYLQTLPGVITTGDRGGQLFIRGGNHTENLALMDGLLIYQPFHILNFFSVFPEELVASADFYAGGFGARYTGRTSSVLDVRMRDGDRNAYSGSGSIGPFVTEAVLEGPLDPGTASVLISARRSLIEETSQTIMGSREPLYFESVFGKATLFGADDSRCSAMLMHTADRGRLDAEDRTSHVGWSNFAVGARCVDTLEGTNQLVEITAGFSRVRNEAVSRGSSEFFSDTRRQQLRVSSTNLFRAVQFEAGGFLYLDEWDFDLRELFTRQAGSADGAKYVWETGGYVEASVPIGPRLQVVPGLVGLITPSGGVEPRLRAAWEPRGRPEEKVTAMFGLYSQPVAGISDMRDASSVFVAWSDIPGDEPTRAMHAILGWEQAVSPTLGWSLEGYFKRIRNVAVPVWDSAVQYDTDLDLGNGRVFGADLRAEYNTPRLYGFLGYGLSWTQYRSAQDHFTTWFGEPVQAYHPPHDRRHQVNLIGSLEAAGFTFGARWQFGSGLPYTRPLGFDEAFDFRDQLDNVSLRHGVPRVILDKPYQGRLPVVHRLDVSASRSFDLPFGEMEAYAGVINAYDRTNIFYYDLFTQRRVDQLPLAPYLSLRLTAP